MTRMHGCLTGVALAALLFCRAEGARQGTPADFMARQVKESTYAGKWKLGELLTKYCDKAAWTYDDKEDAVVFRARVKKGGDELVAHFQVFKQQIGDEKGGDFRWVAVSRRATLGGKKVRDWQARVFEKEYLEVGDMKVGMAKADRYYRWKVGELLAKYCDRPAWSFDKEKDRVEFRGKLKKGGDELVVWFTVAHGPLDKSNTEVGWAVLDSEATRAGKALAVGSTWRAEVFVEETKLMRQGKDEK